MRLKPDPVLEWRRAYPFEDGWRGIVHPFRCHFGTSQHTTQETQKNEPWAPQQGYLTQGFSQAGNLLAGSPPQQQNTVAPFTPEQMAALSGISSRASAGSPIAGAASGFGTDLLNGGYLNANPANGYFSSMAGTNLGLNGPGSSALAQFANGGGAGSDTLKKYASGGYFSNGYGDDVAKTIASQVIPQVGAAFNRGNAINNPAVARVAAEGVTNALAPIEYQNYQTQEQLQQQAADKLAANQLTGATGANASAISGGGLQATGAQGLSGNFQDTLAKMVQGQALAPSTQGMSYADLQQLFQAGQAQQSQNQNTVSAGDASYNFGQMSPYQQLAAYMSAITGGVTGGTSTSTKPYFQNDTANTLGMISGGASILGAAAPLLAFL
jgi:hypothetical protein